MPTATDPQAEVPGAAAGEEGSATVEFILLATLLLIPVIYFLMLTSQIQSAAYAAVAVADQAATAMVSSPDPGTAEARRQAVVALTLQDYGLAAQTATSSVSCTSSPCLEPGSSVTVRVDIRVPVPLIPAGLGWETAAATVSSSAVQPVPRFG